MPAVDYCQPDGLTSEELTILLKRAAGTKRMVGLSIAIFNPTLDPNGDGARFWSKLSSVHSANVRLAIGPERKRMDRSQGLPFIRSHFSHIAM